MTTQTAPEKATPPILPEEKWKFVKRNRLGLALVALLAGLVWFQTARTEVTSVEVDPSTFVVVDRSEDGFSVSLPPGMVVIEDQTDEELLELFNDDSDKVESIRTEATDLSLLAVDPEHPTVVIVNSTSTTEGSDYETWELLMPLLAEMADGDGEVVFTERIQVAGIEGLHSVWLIQDDVDLTTHFYVLIDGDTEHLIVWTAPDTLEGYDELVDAVMRTFTLTDD